MAKIICVTTGLTGILNASFELVHRLKEAGHEVKYAAPREVGEKVKMQDIDFIQLPEIQLEYQGDLPKFKGIFRKAQRLFFKIKNSKTRRQEALEIIQPHAFSKMLENEKPDLVIIDIELHEYIFQTFSMNQSFVLLSQWFSLWKRKGLPYLLLDTIPNKGWRGSRLGIWWSWQKVKLQRSWIFFRKKMRSGGTNRRSVLLELAKQKGFPLSYISTNYWPGPFSYSELPVMCMTALEMEFPHQPSSNVHYLGSMVHENRKEVFQKVNSKYTIEEVLDYKEKIKGSLLYCSVSTLSKGDEVFIQKIITAVKHQKNWVLIIGMGGLIEEGKFQDLPGNVFPFSFVPQLKVLKEADLSINHGGIHTINECIHFGVPMLVYSGKRSDQNGCAARVAYHQLGLMADKDKDRPSDIRKNIKEILKNKSYGQNVNLMREKIESYKNNATLEKLVEQFLAKNTLS